MSTIEAILEGRERVKGCASKTKWKQHSLVPSRVKSDHTYITEIFCYTIQYRPKVWKSTELLPEIDGMEHCHP